ncbi:MAG TPA: YcxB family protein [Polyangia bacterium]|nr:YcxB family protein [Polyangia bacterium]
MEETIVNGEIELEQGDLERPLTQMSWWTRLRWGYVALGVLLALALVSSAKGPIRWTEVLPSFGMMAAFAAVLFYVPRLNARRLLQSLVRAGDARVFYRFDAEGVTIRASGATASFAYRTIQRVQETSTAFLLYTAPGVANIVPKRAFTPADVERVRALVTPQVKIQRSPGLPVKTLVLWGVLIFAFLMIWQLMNAHP